VNGVEFGLYPRLFKQLQLWQDTHADKRDNLRSLASLLHLSDYAAPKEASEADDVP
jgi:hypothetical protein